MLQQTTISNDDDDDLNGQMLHCIKFPKKKENGNKQAI
jgi:hypothetical protein